MLSDHDIKFEEDNWEWPVGGAWGVGWQVMMDGQEITQFTYFQQCGGHGPGPDLRRDYVWAWSGLTQFLQDVDSIYEMVWARQPDTGIVTTYRRDSACLKKSSFRLTAFDYADVARACGST